MKQGLHLHIGQHLSLTPQLQHAIRLLQLSTPELTQEIQEALEKNPLLELAFDQDPQENHHTANTDNKPENDTRSPSNEQTFEQSWDSSYSQSGNKNLDPKEFAFFETNQTATKTLQGHLQEQMQMASFSETDHAIATALIDAINEHGFLSCPLEEIHQSLTELHDDEAIDLDEIEAVLHRIQSFDPIGVAARDIQECLLLQLKQLPDSTPWKKEALSLINKNFNLLTERNARKLCKRLKITETQLHEIMTLIQSLAPRPGSVVAALEPQYITPDIIVTKAKDGSWTVALHTEALPKLRLNLSYSTVIRNSRNETDVSYYKNQLQEAKWLLKSIHSRNETLLKVANCIFQYQKEFLEHGEQAMKPLILSAVAEAIGMHESTISRVTTQKYAETPKGLFELKYFFSSHVGTEDGGECSATAIRAKIKTLVDGENSCKPLSDSKIAHMLQTEGIKVARRTVAKYREAMHIPPSNERKSLV